MSEESTALIGVTILGVLLSALAGCQGFPRMSRTARSRRPSGQYIYCSACRGASAGGSLRLSFNDFESVDGAAGEWRWKPICSRLNSWKETELMKKPKTLAAYTSALNYFTESCRKIYLQEIDRYDLLKFSGFLRDEKEQSPRSVYNKFETVIHKTLI